MFNKLTVAMLALLLLAGCNRGNGVPAVSHLPALAKRQYPIEFPSRPYTDVDPAVKKAWEDVEISYFVVSDKWKHATPATKDEVTKEINDNIFGVNKTVDGLFQEGIKNQPQNPLNYAAYAIYLKPRKRLEPKGFIDTYDEALTNIDKAIKLWPDEPSFYITKIYILTAPHQAHEWMRSGALEDVAIHEHMDQVNDLFKQAEKYDPQNSFINYWHVQLLFRYTPFEQLDKIRGRLLREIHDGNQKTDNSFLFGAPLKPRAVDVPQPLLTAQQQDPIYYDQLVQFGSYSGQTMELVVTALLSKLTWPHDKDQIADLMYFCYNLGRTEPYDRSYFAMQQKIIEKIQRDVDPKSPEAGQLAAAGRYLTDEYSTVGGQLFDLKLIRNPAKANVTGIQELEEGGSRHNDLRDLFQGPEAAYLDKFGQLTGVKFPLPEDKSKW